MNQFKEFLSSITGTAETVVPAGGLLLVDHSYAAQLLLVVIGLQVLNMFIFLALAFNRKRFGWTQVKWRNWELISREHEVKEPERKPRRKRSRSRSG